MRETAVPCINARPPYWAGHLYTFEDDRLCGRCRPSSAATSPGSDAGESMASASPASSSLSGFLSKPARDAQQCAADDGPRPRRRQPLTQPSEDECLICLTLS